jgi:outer membrane lipoprotein LolB
MNIQGQKTMPREAPKVPSVLRSFSPTFCLLISVLLCACASFSPPSAQTDLRKFQTFSEGFSLEGRFSFRFEERNYFGRISWRHSGASDAILLSSSFGQGIAEITVGETSARLVLPDGKTHEAPDTETLLRAVLGYPLSIKRLAGWISGRGAREENVDADTDAYGRLRRLRHEGWIVDYAYENDGAFERPSRIYAVRADTQAELRLAIEDWQALPFQKEPALSEENSGK